MREHCLCRDAAVAGLLAISVFVGHYRPRSRGLFQGMMARIGIVCARSEVRGLLSRKSHPKISSKDPDVDPREWNPTLAEGTP